jgi:hypothetical protein
VAGSGIVVVDGETGAVGTEVYADRAVEPVLTEIVIDGSGAVEG